MKRVLLTDKRKKRYISIILLETAEPSFYQKRASSKDPSDDPWPVSLYTGANYYSMKSSQFGIILVDVITDLYLPVSAAIGRTVCHQTFIVAFQLGDICFHLYINKAGRYQMAPDLLIGENMKLK